MQKTGKQDTRELYRDRNVQMLLSKFLSGEIETLEPVYDSDVGYRYPIVEAIVGEEAQVASFLNKLQTAGILEKELYDKIVFCPKCGSASVSTRYCCPFCKSFDIQKSALVEHIKCGYMDTEDKFRKGETYVCPKCNEELKQIDVDYQKAGIWCACRNCKKSFDTPVTMHFCRNCGETYTFEDAVIRDVYAYSLKENVTAESSINLFLVSAIREFLMKEKMTVESPGLLRGKSGANHSFDIVAYPPDKSRAIVVDLAMSTGPVVSEQPVIALFAKIFDVSPDKSYLIAIPKLNENGKKMAELYKILAIEAKNQEEAIATLEASLKTN